MRPDPSEKSYHEIWYREYQCQNYSRGLSAVVLRNSHAIIERPFRQDVVFERVLELGAGGGAHLEFVRHQFEKYIITDASEAMLNLARERYGQRKGVSFELVDARQVKIDPCRFDRVIATHVLEHLADPHKILRHWAQLLRPNGMLSLILPCDPGLAWRLGRKLGPRSKWQSLGIPYDYWMAREHINSIYNLRSFIRYYFDNVQEYWYPFSLVPSADINLVYGCNITVP